MYNLHNYILIFSYPYRVVEKNISIEIHQFFHSLPKNDFLLEMGWVINFTILILYVICIKFGEDCRVFIVKNMKTDDGHSYNDGPIFITFAEVSTCTWIRWLQRSLINTLMRTVQSKNVFTISTLILRSCA